MARNLCLGTPGAVAKGYVSPTLPDPMVSVGRLRILPIATGGFLAYDETRPVGDRTVAVGDTIQAAVEAAKRFLAAENA